MPSCTTKVPVQVISQVIHSVLLVIMFIAQDIQKGLSKVQLLYTTRNMYLTSETVLV